MKRSLVIAGALVATAIVLTLALGGVFAQDAFADSAISGKINFLPWEGTGGILVLLPPAYSGMGTTIPLAPALVSPKPYFHKCLVRKKAVVVKTKTGYRIKNEIPSFLGRNRIK